MEDSQRDLLSHVERLQSDVDEMRLRLSVLEAAVGLRLSSETTCDRQLRPAGAAAAGEAVPQAATLAPLFGWAFLGLAGAYLLRGLTESGSVPALIGVAVGIIYSGWWLFLAASRASSKPVASTVYALTAVLILAPLLWEATIRFAVFNAAAASVVLVAFTAFGLAIGWRHNLTGIACAATFTGLLTPMALFRETHEAQPWVITVLAIAAAVEFSACKDHWLGLRWVAAAVADGSVLLLTALVTTRHVSAQTPGFASTSFVLGAQIALLGIYLASTVDRTLIRKLPISFFEIGQAAVAFLVSVGGALRLAEVTSLGWIPVGLFCLAAGLICYSISFAMLDRVTWPSRNFYTYSTFGLLLLITACGLLTGREAVATAWALLAVCLVSAALIAKRRTLRVHAGVLLMLATIAAGVLQTAWASLMNTVPTASAGVSASYLTVLVSALLVYWGTLKSGRGSKPVSISAPEAFVPAAVFGWSAAGAVAAFATNALVGSTPVRTAVLTALTLAAAGLGVYARRIELMWVSYTFVFATGVKLFAEDFRVASSLGFVVSLGLFGIVLIVLPRMVRVSRIQPDTVEHALANRAGK